MFNLGGLADGGGVGVVGIWVGRISAGGVSNVDASVF